MYEIKKTPIISSVGEEQMELLHIAGGNAKWYNYSGKVWQFLVKLNIYSLYNPTISLLRIYPKEIKTYTLKIYKNVNRSSIKNHQKLELTHMYFNG